ncbi:MAG: hypothetical protein WAK01_08775 [Methylocystis sp.]
MVLLRDGVAVHKEEPRFAGRQQPVQVAQRRQRDQRNTDLYGAAIDRIELPGRNHRDDAGLEFEMCDLSGCATLNQNTTCAPAAQRMPAILDNGGLPDMGRMTARLH